MDENLSSQCDDEIDEPELDAYVNNIILDAQASLANVLITVDSTSTAIAPSEEVMTLSSIYSGNVFTYKTRITES